MNRTIDTTRHDHAGVAPRNRFLPPRTLVGRLHRDTREAWMRLPAVAAFTDMGGERFSARVAARLAYDDHGLHLHARVFEPVMTAKPSLPLDSAQFWMQDHVELRFLRDVHRDLDQVQFITVSDGRAWDNQALWRKPGVVMTRGWRTADGWAVRLTVPFAALGVATPDSGCVWRGIVAHTRWADGHADIVCSSATELGFAQADRFGEWAFADDTGSVTLESIGSASGQEVKLRLSNTARRTLAGRLRVRHEQGTDGSNAHSVPVRLTPGVNCVAVTLPREYPLFTRHAFDWVDEKQARELGAVSLRDPMPVLAPMAAAMSHPYLAFDAAGLRDLRAKARHAPFVALTRGLRISEADLTGCDLPDPSSAALPRVTAGCLNWFRVAKETMVRDGEGGLKPAAQRLWALQSDDARSAWRRIVADVMPPEAEVRLLIDELNGLLARRDFYDAVAFGSVSLPEEGRRMLGRGTEALRDDEVFRLNRMLLQGSVECLHNYRMDLAFRPGELWAKWLATGEPRLVATATKAVRAALKLTLFGHEIHLHEGMAAGSLALAYDAFYPHLARGDRAPWQELLQRLLHLYLDTARASRWTVTTIANANPVGNGGCGLAALALWREHPALTSECLGFVRTNLRLWLDYCQGVDGGNTEGAQYWQYGVDNFLRFAVALERVTGSDDGLLSHPSIRNGMNMIRASLCNDGALHGINDTVPMPIGSTLAWFLAGHFGDAFGLWYGDHALRWCQAREADGKTVVYRPGTAEMLLYRPDVPEVVASPPLPEAFALHSIAYGIVRSGPEFDCRWTAGLKGSRPPYTHHNQADTGAFFADLRGERLLIDPGYYKPEATDHSLPLIGGHGPLPSAGWMGAIVACELHGDLRYLAVDATGAYKGAADRVVRHLVLAGDEGIVLLDDIVAAAPVTMQYQCGGVPALAKGGRSLMIAGQRARLMLEWVGGPKRRVEVRHERSLHDVHWGYHFANCRMFPVSAGYAADEFSPLVTVLTDITRRQAASSRVDTNGPVLSVRLPSGRRVGFVHVAGRWQWDPHRVEATRNGV